MTNNTMKNMTNSQKQNSQLKYDLKRNKYKKFKKK